MNDKIEKYVYNAPIDEFLFVSTSNAMKSPHPRNTITATILLITLLFIDLYFQSSKYYLKEAITDKKRLDCFSRVNLCILSSFMKY